jgi:hypothetical protein
MALKHLRSSTANKRPSPAVMAEGQLAVNTAAASTGLFFKDSTGALVKTGPVHIGTTAPNADPAEGGQAGNSVGEAWLDTTGTNALLKIWDGSVWKVVQPVAAGDVVSTSDTGTVTSTMIADGTIVDADVNASAAIAGTKISPNFGSQNVVTTGTSTAASLIPTGSSVPTNGVYLPAANSVGISTNGAQRATIDSSGRVGLRTTAPTTLFQVRAQTNTVTDYPLTVTNSTANYGLSIGAYGLSNRTFGATSVAYTFDIGGNAIFSTANTERMRLDSSGRLGLGTSAPDALLHLSSATGSATPTPTEIRIATTTNANNWSLTDPWGRVSFYSQDLSGSGPKIHTSIDCTSAAGSGASSNLFFKTSSNTSNTLETRLMIVGDSGNVGIGTTNPLTHLQVQQSVDLTSGDVSGSNRGTIFLNNSGTLTQAQGTLATGIAFTGTSSPTRRRALIASYQSSSNSNQTGLKFFVRSSSTTGSDSLFEAVSVSHVGTTTLTSGATIPPFIANIGTSEVARIDSSGRLLVGTATARTNFLNTTAFAQLQVEGTTTSGSSASLTANGTTSATNPIARLYLSRSRGGLGANALVSANDVLGAVTFQGNDGTEFVEAASIAAAVDGTPGADDMPGRLVFSTTASGASTPTEQARLTNTGALLIGTTTTPVGASSGAVVAQDRVVISSFQAGRNQTIVDNIPFITATTGTVVFKFKNLVAGARACYVKLAISQRVNNNTPSNLPAAEYAFQLHNETGGVCSINSTTTIFEHTYDRATHFAFADLGSNECTVTLTNPTALSLEGSYKVEILTQGGTWTLDSVTTT